MIDVIQNAPWSVQWFLLYAAFTLTHQWVIEARWWIKGLPSPKR
jgi:hypothetical protein